MLEMIFAQILKMSLTAGVCIVVVSMLHLLFHRIPRKYLYALWIVVAFRLVCPVSVSTPVGLVLMGNVGQIKQTSVTDELVQSEQAVGDGQWSTDDVRKAVDSQVAGTMQGESVVGDGDSVTTAQNNMTDKTAMQDNTTGTAQSTASNVSTDNTANDQSMLPLLSRIWLTGMLLSLIYLLYSYLKTKRRLSHAVLAEDTTSERLIHTGWRLAPVYECDELPSPFAMGIFHPVIYIPFGLEACRREMILLHEQYHIRRRDHLVKLFASVLLAVYWFHPLVWLSWVILCRDMEMSCDEKVLELLGSEQRKAYSLTLLQFASGESAGYVPLGFGEPNVKSRINHVLRFKKAAVGTGVVGVVILIATILLLGSNRQQNIRDSANTDTASSTQENADETQSDSSNVSDAATLLYSVKNPYVGDISADGKVLRAIEEVRPGSVYAGKTELQTSEEPYEYHFLLEQNKETLKVKTGTEESKLNQEMSRTAVLMLALIDNLGEVQWNYALIAEDGTENDVLYTSYVDIDSAQQWLGVDNIKAYAESPEKMQEFLNLLDTVSGDAIEGANTEIDGTASITHREGFQNATLHYYVPKSSEGIVATTGIYTEEEAEAHAQRAVQEIYDLTGFQVTECYYYAYDFGTVDLGMSEADLEHSRVFYSRCFADLPGDTTSIASAYLANAQKVWYSPVKMMILPDRYDMMSEGEKAVWFVTHSGQYNGQKVYATYQDYADQPETWTVVMDDETAYEITLEADTNSFSNLTGPYPDGNILH